MRFTIDDFISLGSAVVQVGTADYNARIEYLSSKGYSNAQIAKIIHFNKKIADRFGFLP